jgi:hypothetical protein
MNCAFSAALVLCLQGGEDEAAKRLEAEAKRRIAEFNKAAAKAASPDDLVQAVKELGATRHPRILAELKKLASHDAEIVRRQAVDEIAAYANAEALKALLSVLPKEAARAAYDDMGQCRGHETARQILDLLDRFEIDDAALKSAHGYLAHKVPMIAAAAVELCARLRRTESVDPLISLLRSLETLNAPQPSVPNRAPGGAGFVKGSPQGGPTGPDAWAAWHRKQQLPAPVHSALEAILGQRKPDAAEYQKLWTDMKKKAKEQEREKNKPKPPPPDDDDGA